MKSYLKQGVPIKRALYCFVLLLFMGCNQTEQSSQAENNFSENDSLEAISSEKNDSAKVIVFFGNSLTAGYGLDPQQAFPNLIQQKIETIGLNYKVINAGLSGETTASGKSRLSWILKQKIDVFVLELGANDGLRGINLEETHKNLQEIILLVRKKYPGVKILLAGMKIPPSMGADYVEKFQEIYPDLAKKNEIKLIPFLLEDVAGEPDLNQADGIHPTAKGDSIVAENVWKVLKGML